MSEQAKSMIGSLSNSWADVHICSSWYLLTSSHQTFSIM